MLPLSSFPLCVGGKTLVMVSTAESTVASMILLRPSCCRGA